MRDIRYIFIHCTAGFGSIDSIKRYWKEQLKWRSVGYHRIVDLAGDVHCLSDYEQVTNGVKYYNSKSIHISYIGGVDKKDYKIAKDTRTEAQKEALICEIKNALQWCKDKGIDTSKIKILGHRDISPDKNLNGRVDAWERIKECPSFDAIDEYKYLLDEI